MNDFWKSYDITHAEYGADYRCYPLYGTVHLMELAISLAFIVGTALWYRRSSARTRRRILVGVTALLLLDEAALLLGMALTGQWNWSYLPLHLCNINVFVCLSTIATILSPYMILTHRVLVVDKAALQKIEEVYA